MALESASLDGLTGQRLFQPKTQIKRSIFKMAEVSKNSVTQQLIGENEHGQRLDNLLLKLCKGVPKSHVYSIVRSGQVRVNGRRAEVSYRLQSGDLLRIPPLRIGAANRKSWPVPSLKVHLPVVYEDEALLVVDKPAGIAVHGGSGESFGVIEALRRQRPQAVFSNWHTGWIAKPPGPAARQEAFGACWPCTRCFRAGAAAARGAPTNVTWCWSRAAGWTRCAMFAALAQVSAGLGRAAGACRRRGQGGAYGVPAAGALAAFQPARSGTADRANAPDPRSSRASRLSDRR
jgi:hypothetical protein